MDRIFLKDLRFWGRHGVYTEEKERPQEFRLDLSIAIDLKEAAEGDDLSLTLDYEALYRKIKSLVEETSSDLLETLAEKIAALILKEPRALSVKLKLEKCRVKSGEDIFSAGVEIERR